MLNRIASLYVSLHFNNNKDIQSHYTRQSKMFMCQYKLQLAIKKLSTIEAFQDFNVLQTTLKQRIGTFHPCFIKKCK